MLCPYSLCDGITLEDERSLYYHFVDKHKMERSRQYKPWPPMSATTGPATTGPATTVSPHVLSLPVGGNLSDTSDLDFVSAGHAAEDSTIFTLHESDDRHNRESSLDSPEKWLPDPAIKQCDKQQLSPERIDIVDLTSPTNILFNFSEFIRSLSPPDSCVISSADSGVDVKSSGLTPALSISPSPPA
jgi:hypothetical protein